MKPSTYIHIHTKYIHASRGREMEGLTEEEKKALRGSKFAPLPSASATNQTRSMPRLAHPGGAMKTNKAAALAKFLERKLQEPNGLSSVDPKLVELAVKNAKQTVQRSGASTSGRVVHHVNKFEDFEDSEKEDITETSASKKLMQKKKKKKKKKKEKNQKKKQKKLDDSIADASKRPKKKLKL